MLPLIYENVSDILDSHIQTSIFFSIIELYDTHLTGRTVKLKKKLSSKMDVILEICMKNEIVK